MTGLLARLGFRAQEKSVAPAAPASGSRLLYPKSDGWYDLSSAGAETKLAVSNTGPLTTAVTNSSANTVYPDNSTYFKAVVTADGFPFNGTLSGMRIGTEHTQYIQGTTAQQIVSRYWITGSSTWSAWSAYLDATDFDAAGDLLVGTGADTYQRFSRGNDYQYLQSNSGMTAGVNWINPTAITVRSATSSNNALSGIGTYDNVAVASGDIVLVRAQTNAAQNGIYIANSAGAWTRHPTFNSIATLGGLLVSVQEGLANGGTVFHCTTKITGGIIGTTLVNFAPVHRSGQSVNGQMYMQPPVGWDLPTGFFRSNITASRSANLVNNLTPLTTQREYVTAVWLNIGETVSQLTFITGGTAVGTPVHWWFSLRDSNLGLLRQTADQAAAAWGATTVKTLSLSSSYTATYSGLYYVGLMVQATTMPALLGVAQIATVGNLAPVTQGQTADTALTTTAPATAGAVTAQAGHPLCYLSP